MVRKIEQFELAASQDNIVPDEGQVFYFGEMEFSNWIVAINEKGVIVEIFNMDHVSHIVLAKEV